LPTSNEALIGVEVDRPQGERRAPARSLGVQAQQQCAESRVVAAGRCNVVDLCEARVGDRGGSRAAGVAWRPFGRIVAGLDVAVVLGVPVQAAQGGDQVLAAPRPPRAFPARNDVGLEVLGELVDLGRGRLVQPSGAPVLDDPVPVRPVHPPRPAGHGRADNGDVLAGCGWRAVRGDCQMRRAGEVARLTSTISSRSPHSCPRRRPLTRAVGLSGWSGFDQSGADGEPGQV
jgi:hypothetical protein